MKLNIGAFVCAQTVTVAILYVVCSFFVRFLPDASVSVARYVFHADLSGMMRPLSLGGFIAGLLITSLGWGLLSLIMASLYNGRIGTKILPS